MTEIERLATWAADLDIAQVPTGVLELCRAQRRSVLGAIAASSKDAAARRVLAAIQEKAPPGPAPLFGTNVETDPVTAVYGAAVSSVALDFDDYVCFGHTGHSSVLVPLLLAAETHADSSAQLAAQVAANEIEARLGGACLIGPLNGQMWSFIHAAGAAIAAGRSIGLDASRMAHALALSLYQTNRPTVPGFMAPDSKVLTTAEPMALGMRCAQLAAKGVTGPLDILDHPHGFFSAFSYAPIRGLLGGLGEGWATNTLSVKDYPGCAYIDTTIDALLELDLPDPDRVARVDVHAGLLTCGMNALSEQYQTDVPTPVTVNFSIPWNVAIVLLTGRLTPDEVNASWLSDNATDLRKLAARVTLRHDIEESLLGLKRMAGLLSPRSMRRELGNVRLARGLRQARRDHPRLRLTPGDLRQLIPAVRSRGGSGSARYWDPTAIEDFQMTFPAHVEVSLKDGSVLRSRCEVPRGGAGNQVRSASEVAGEKLTVWGPRLWPDVDLIDKAISEDADDLLETLRS